MKAPEIRYARSGDVNVAYSVVGDGPFDVGEWRLFSVDPTSARTLEMSR